MLCKRLALALMLLGAPCATAADLPLAINVGSNPNDKTGDGLRTAFLKTMAAVNALHSARGAPSGIATLGSDGKLLSSQAPSSGLTPSINAQSGVFRAGLTSPPGQSGSVVSVQTTDVTAQDVFNPQVPAGWYNYEGVRSALDVQPSTTAITTSAFGSYVRNRAVSGGLGGNAAGYYGAISCEVDNAACFGLNPTLIDARANGSTTSGTGRKLIGMEIDFSVTSPNTIVQGISLNGSSQVQPAGADGYTCGSMGGPAKWRHCFTVPDGTTEVGLYLGAASFNSGAVPGVPIQFNYHRSDSSGQAINMAAALDSINIIPATFVGNGVSLGVSGEGIAPTIAVNTPEANQGLEFRAKGTGQIVSRSDFTAATNLTVNGIATVGRATLAALPVSNVPAGALYYCTNCLRPGQGAGAGTGMLVFRDASNWVSTAGTTAAQ